MSSNGLMFVFDDLLFTSLKVEKSAVLDVIWRPKHFRGLIIQFIE